MTFGSLFAGIGGFDLGLTRAGMRSLYAAEIDERCNSIRKRHWPDELCLTNVLRVDGRLGPDLVCAGWPCQGNSAAGRRAGLADVRSGLWIEVVRVLAEQRPRWFLGENVPGLLSVNGGRDFGAVLGSLAKLGYGFAYRILDAQWFGVAQRRRRLFIVGSLGGWRSCAEVLFERESLPWDSPPRREAGSRVAASLTRGAESSGRGGYAGRRREDDVNIGTALTTRQTRQSGDDNYVVGTITHNGKAAGSATNQNAENGQLVVYQCCGSNVGPMGTVRRGSGSVSGGTPFVACDYATGAYRESQTAAAMTRCSDRNRGVPLSVEQKQVRRLTPKECERLMGFPDDWTIRCDAGRTVPNGPRYQMLGNAVVPAVAEWIGRRIVETESRNE